MPKHSFQRHCEDSDAAYPPIRLRGSWKEAAISTTVAESMPDQPKAVRIFQSYGWKDATEISRRLKESLAAAGYNVWLDREQLRADDKHFSLALEDAVKDCEIVVALISPHSARGGSDRDERSSICYNELRLAEELPRPIIPIRVQPLRGPPPFIVIKYHRIDWLAWEEPDAYDAGFQQILAAIKRVLAGDKNLDPDIAFQTTSFVSQLFSARDGFVGRHWLFERLGQWLESGKSAFMIEAPTGSGKTAIVAELVRRNPGGRILAYHFCNDEAVTLEPAAFVRSIAAMIANSVDSYADQLWNAKLADWLKGADPHTMLSQGVLAPLHKERMDGNFYIVVDALDEALGAPAAQSAGQTSLPQLLARALGKFPPWLKLLVTTRPHPRIQRLFATADTITLSGNFEQQRVDLRAYIGVRLAGAKLQSITRDASDAAALIEDSAASSFQYAASVLDALEKGDITVSGLNRLPKQLEAFYYERAEARFSSPPAYRPARIIFELLLAAREPLTLRQLQTLSGLDRDMELQPTLDSLTGFVGMEPGGGEDVYRIAHKSISDWLLSSQAGYLSVDPAQGRVRLLAHCRAWNDHHEPYALRHAVGHLLEEGQHVEVLRMVEQGLFKDRLARLAEPRLDAEDSRNLTMALVAAKDQTAILALARTENIWQRDGVAAALQSTPLEDLPFVDQVTGALLGLKP